MAEVIEFGIAVTVILLLIYICYTDIKTGLIPNWVPAVVFVMAITQHIYHGRWMFALVGMMVPVVLLIPGYLYNAVGGGDVKLLIALGVYMGVQGWMLTLTVACLVAVTFMVGWMVHKRVLGQYMREQWASFRKRECEIKVGRLEFPFGPYIAAAAILVMLVPQSTILGG